MTGHFWPARVRWSRLFFYLAIALPLSGCGSFFYLKTPTGSFSGKLDVEWIAPNQFIYRPHTADPLIYRTSDGRKIQPRTMFTDGGSIPRLFWSAPGFGPWDFAPGFIIHDWLFVQHRCKEGDWEAYDFPRSAAILAEAIKTQMENGNTAEPTVVWAIHEAVSTPIAKHRWDANECSKPPPEAPAGVAGAPVSGGVKLMTIQF